MTLRDTENPADLEHIVGVLERAAYQLTEAGHDTFTTDQLVRQAVALWPDLDAADARIVLRFKQRQLRKVKPDTWMLPS